MLKKEHTLIDVVTVVHMNVTRRGEADKRKAGKEGRGTELVAEMEMLVEAGMEKEASRAGRGHQRKGCWTGVHRR